MPNFDQLIEIEDLLIDQLGPLGEVDGHDSGDNECNIFIITNEAYCCFTEVFKIVCARWANLMSAGFRKIGDDTYNPIWPNSLESFNVS